MEGYFLRDEEESLSQPCGDGNKIERNPQGDSMKAGKLMDLRPTGLKKPIFTCNNAGVLHIRSCSEATVMSPPGGSAMKLVNLGLSGKNNFLRLGVVPKN